MLDSRLTRGDGDVGKGGVKNMLARPTPTPTTSSHTYTHIIAPPSLQIIMLSAATVLQTVRGSLGGVPQGSVIGPLEKPPQYGHLQTGQGSEVKG